MPTLWSGPALATGGWLVPPVENACISASPTSAVVALTLVMVRVRLVTVRELKVMVTPAPELVSEPTATLAPLEKVSVPAVIWSSLLGRSKRTTWLMVTGDAQVSFNQLPAPAPRVAHSWV